MITDERQEFLRREIYNWYTGIDGYPSEFGEMLGKLNTTDEEERWIHENVEFI